MNWIPGDRWWTCCIPFDLVWIYGGTREQRLDAWMHFVLHRQRGDRPFAPD